MTYIMFVPAAAVLMIFTHALDKSILFATLIFIFVFAFSVWNLQRPLKEKDYVEELGLNAIEAEEVEKKDKTSGIKASSGFGNSKLILEF